MNIARRKIVTCIKKEIVMNKEDHEVEGEAKKKARAQCPHAAITLPPSCASTPGTQRSSYISPQSSPAACNPSIWCGGPPNSPNTFLLSSPPLSSCPSLTSGAFFPFSSVPAAPSTTSDLTPSSLFAEGRVAAAEEEEEKRVPMVDWATESSLEIRVRKSDLSWESASGRVGALKRERRKG